MQQYGLLDLRRICGQTRHPRYAACGGHLRCGVSHVRLGRMIADSRHIHAVRYGVVDATRWANMRHSPLPTIPNVLFGCITSLHDDDLLPVTVPAPTREFVHRLAKQCDHSSKPLAKFLVGITASQLTDSVLRIVAGQQYHSICREYELLGQPLSDAVAECEWGRCVSIRTEREKLKSQLRQLSQDPWELRPGDIVRALAKLGFDGYIKT